MATKKPKEPKHPVLPQDRVRFEELMHQWQVYMNLMDWRFVLEEKPSRYMAEVSQESEHRLVKWRLGKHFGSVPVTEASLEATAIHENLHVLLHTLVETACAHGESNEHTMAEEHRVIAVLERLLSQLAGYYKLEARAKAHNVLLEDLVRALEVGTIEPSANPGTEHADA